MSDHAPLPTRLYCYDIDDRHSMWHQFVQPRLNSVQFCILRIVCSTFRSRKHNLRESRFEYHARNGGTPEECSRFVLREIETVEQCEILLGLSVLDRSAPCRELQKAAWKTNAVAVLKWIAIMQAPFFTYLRECGSYYSKLMPKLAATGDRDLVELCLPTDNVDVLAGFLSGPSPIEKKMKQIERTDTKLRHLLKMGKRSAKLWAAAVKSGCLDLMKYLHSTTLPNRVGLLNRYSLATTCIPPTIEALDWLLANDMVCAESRDCMKHAAVYGNIALLRHMQGLRELNPPIFPLISLALQQALWLRHFECAKYLVEIGCPVDVACLDVAVKIGSVEMAEMIIAKGVSTEAIFPFFYTCCLSVDHQAQHVQMAEFLVRNGHKLTNVNLRCCIKSGCAELAVYIHKQGTTDDRTILTPTMLEEWRSRSCAFNEYIDAHAGLKFAWGPSWHEHNTF
jgi:hypothetical protein